MDKKFKYIPQESKYSKRQSFKPTNNKAFFIKFLVPNYDINLNSNVFSLPDYILTLKGKVNEKFKVLYILVSQ